MQMEWRQGEIIHT